MKKFKKVLALLLILTMLCALCACGNTTTEESVEETPVELSEEQSSVLDAVTKVWKDGKYTEDEMDSLISTFEPDKLEAHLANKELYGLFDEAGNQVMNWCQLIEQGYISSFGISEYSMIFDAERGYDPDFELGIWRGSSYESTEKTKELAGILILPEKAEIGSDCYDNFLKDCKDITEFYAPGFAVDKVEAGFFEGCENLITVELGDAYTKNHKEIKIEEFAGWKGFEETKKEGPVSVANALITWGDKEADTILCPLGVECWSWELNDTNRAKRIIFPVGSVTKIEKDILSDNDYVEEVIIEEGCVEIGEDAFLGCSKLKTVSVPESVTSIGGSAFGATPFISEMHGRGHENIIINGILVSSNVFSQSNTETKLVIDDSITQIMPGAFSSGLGLSGWAGIEKELFIGKNMTVIGSKAFLADSFEGSNSKIDFSTVHFEGPVTEIGYSAFENCNIENITFPNTLKVIGMSAFANNNFTTLVIPDSVEEIDTLAFENCKFLKEITIPANCDVSGSAFEGCDSLTKINYEGDDGNYPWGAPSIQ